MDRNLYKQLIDWKASPNRKPLIVGGTRQVGKTFLLKEFGRKAYEAENRRVHYFDFEKTPDLASIFERDLDAKRIANDLSIVSNTKIDHKFDLLILDEIQECPKAITALKQFQQEIPELAVCAAGSLLGVTLGQASYPVGKVNHMTLHPLNFREFLSAIGEDLAVELLDDSPKLAEPSEIVHRKMWELLKRYFVVGGLPEAVRVYSEQAEEPIEALAAVRGVQQDLAISYLADMAKHSGKTNSMHLERLWVNIPAQLRASQDGSAKKFVFKDAVPGLRGYARLVGAIDWLIAAGLVTKISIANQAMLPLGAYIKDNYFKLMMFDVGLLGSTSNLEPATQLGDSYGSFKGYFAENFVSQELTAAGRRSLHSWAEGKSEVEFVSGYQDQVVPVEVKSGTSGKTRSLASFIKKYQPPLAVILSGHSSLKIADSHQVGTRLLKAPLYLAGELDKILRTHLEV